ncbi:hypothetical protein TRSC58_06939 [Trypanosoma rangeli SC58]|uniref:Uncharacterized protein n=1 Tax=Trypanosoma rangeli SC58 TaxID=429131 RepID=A0A061ISK0_TRYRA|nr:hypothetical protein TRSC58_06939 [Trypanosoma rangeli SC58]
MVVYIRLCCVRDSRQQMLLNTVAEAREDRPHTPTAHSGGFTGKSNNAGIIDGIPLQSALASGREVFWRSIIFPHTLSGWQNSPIATAWQALLRHVFCDASLLKMWFQGDKSLKSHSTVLDPRHTSSAEMAEDNTAGGGHGRRGRRRRRGGGGASGVTPSSSCREEKLRQLQELVYFLGRRFSFDNHRVMFPSLHLEENNETWRDLQTDVPRTAGMDADKNVRLSALSTLLTRHEEVEEIGRALFQACVRDDLALADASNVWRTFIFSIAPQQVAPLLRCMMGFAATESCDGSGKSSCFAALVVVMHESDVFSSEDKARYTVMLSNSIEPVTNSWRVALALFGEAAPKISEPPLDGENDRSLRHILDALLVSAVPPRWREALQVVEIVHELVPNAGDAQSMDKEDGSTGGSTGPLPGRTPLSDSERIDLYEALAPLKRRRHWLSAMELFTVYEVRQLSGHDCACFAFAVADGPLSFARRVLLSLRGREKSREVARAALVASERYVKQAVRALKQRQHHQLEQRESGVLEQERMLVLHEATQVARLALTVWPTTITSDEDFRLIWKLVRGICDGNVAAAKLLLRQSGLYDSEQAKNEADALTRTVRLCHTAQDAASATAAYKTFRDRFIGMVLPEETMLQLLALCVARVVDVVEDATTRDRITMLHTVLRDTLWMHDSSLRYEGSHTTMPRNCMLQVCMLLFRLSAPSENTAVMGIPRFSCDMTPNMQRCAQHLLGVVTNHLVSSDARLLRNLPDFIGVLRALPPFCLGAVIASAPTSTSKKLWTNSIATLTHHVQHLEKTLGPVVPVECLFWLGILQSEQTVSGALTPPPSLLSTTGEDGEGEKVSGREFRGVPRWDPEAFVVLNDFVSKQEATALLNRTIHCAVEFATRGDAESMTTSSSLRAQLLPCIMEALVFLLHHRWNAQPPLTATLAAAAYAVRSLHEAPEWISSEAAMDIIAALHTIFAAFHVRHTVASLAVLAHSMHRLSSAVDAILSGTGYEAVRHMHDFVLLVSVWMQKRLQAAEGAERQVLNERQIHFMIWIAGNLTGTCASWPDSPLREECMCQLSRSCEMVERCVNCGYTSPMSCSALLLLRVMGIIFQKGPLSNDTAEALFSVTAVSKHSSSSHLNVGFPAGNASLSAFLMAVTLLHIVYQGTRPDMRLVRAFLPALQLDEELQKTLHDDDAFVGGLVAMQCARLNATTAVRRALGVSLSLSTRFIVRLVQFSPMLSLEASTVQWLRSEEQLAEVAIFAALAACRGGGTPEEHDIVEAMDAVGTLVPHRWDLPYAMALGFPLPAKQSVTLLERILRQRLAVVLQYCGPWPGGIVLALLLQAVWPALDTKKDDGVLPDYNQLLEVMATLSLDRRWQMISITPSLPHGTSPLLMHRVALWHRQASTVACIIMGNAIPRQQEQQRQQRQRYCEAWNALSTSDAAVQFLVIAYVVAPLLGTRSTSQEQRQQRLLLADMKSWILSSLTSASNLSWPWQSLSAEARQLLLWSRVALMFPRWASVREQKRETVAAEQSVIAAAVSLVSSSHAVSSSFSSHFGKSKRTVSALPYATTDARATGFSCTLCFRHALFNTAWVAEMCAKQFMLEHPSIYARLCRALRVLPDASLMGMNANDVDDDETNVTESLFATPSGFSSLQYACALVDTANEAAELRSERGFLLLLACTRSMQEASELLESRLSQRPYTPLCIPSLLAAWNTLLIRSVELEWEGEAGAPPMGHGAEAHADLDVEEHKNEKRGKTPLRHRVAAAFLALALTSESNTCDVPISVASLQPEESEKLLLLLQRLYREIFVHSASADALLGTTLNTTPSESRFYRTSADIVARAILLLPKGSTSASFFDVHVASAIEFVRQYVRGDTVSWVSLWPPLVLEMWRSSEYVKCIQEQKQSPVSPCKLRHPVAVSWMMQQSAAHATLLGTVTRPLMAIFNTLRSYVMTGTASFSPSHEATVKETAKATGENSATLYGVRGAGAGMVVDQFLSMALRGRASIHPHDSTEGRDRDVIRHLVDAVLPHSHIVDSSAPTSSLFLLGYTPLTTDGLQSLVRLLVLRDGFYKRRTASINHVEKFLRMEKQREMARRIAARDAGVPLTRVHFGRPRGSRDVQVQLLFYLRALAAALTFVNPMAWHGERQASLDVAYTALIDFLHLCSITYGEDVDIASRQVKAELEGIFGRGVMRVVSAAASRPDSIVNVRQLLHFLTGGLHHHHHRDAKGGWREAALLLNRRLRELLRVHRRGGEVVDVLLLRGDDVASAPAPAPTMPLFTRMTSIVREALWDTAVVPSHDVVLELLDVAVTACASDSATASVEAIHAARCGLQLFETIAPYIVVPTIILEKVLMLLLVVLRPTVAAAAADETARKQERELFESILHLVLRRFQYVPLNTPTAVALLCELYAAATTMNETSATCKSAEELAAGTCTSHFPLLPASEAPQLPHVEWLLWRCVLEANQVPWPLLQVALSSASAKSLRLLQHGCCAFLLQDHRKPHYDPPFLRLGRMLDTVILQESGEASAVTSNDFCGIHVSGSFTAQLLRKLEVVSTGIASSVVPWHRALQFLPEPQDGSVDAITDMMRFRFYVTLMSQLLTAATKRNDGVRQVWQHALSVVLPQLASAKEKKEFDTELIHHGAACALRVLHIAQPSNEWDLALQLTLQLPVAATNSVSWWSSPAAPLFHTLRYLIEVCDVATIPITALVSYMQVVAKRQLSAAGTETTTGRFNRLKVVAAFTTRVQRHPRLSWVDALALLESMSVLEKGFAKPTAKEASNQCPSNSVSAQEHEVRLVLTQAKGEFVTAVMGRLYNKQSYESLLRFVEAAQQYCRVSGRESMAWVNHAASVVVAPSQSGGLSEVLLLLNGTLVGKTIDDILREQSAGVLQGRVSLMRDLLRSGHCVDAAVLSRQTPALLETREFYDACTRLMNRSHHSAVVAFYDAFIHPEEELDVEMRQVDAACVGGGDRAMTALLEEEVRYAEDADLLRHVPSDALQQAMDAFEVAANTVNGINMSEKRTGLWIAATWIRRVTPLVQAQHSLAATLRWVHRDLIGGTAGKPDGGLYILADAVRDVLHETASHGSGHSCGTPTSKASLAAMLGREREVARLLVETLSGTFPGTASELCESLLSHERHSTREPGVDTTVDCDNGDGNNNDEAWRSFLHCTAAYNVSLEEGFQRCRTLVDTSVIRGSACNPVVEWRDRALFSNGGTSHAWVLALATYATTRSFVGHTFISGAHMARLVKLITASGSLRVVIPTARNVFFQLPSSPPNSGDSSLLLDALLLLCSAMRTMKRHTIQRFRRAAEAQSEELQAILDELHELHRFVGDGLALLLKHQQRASALQGAPLDGRVELACNMLQCLTVTPATSVTSVATLKDWRSLVQRIITALSPAQRCGDLLDALMESVRDSFEVLSLLREHPVSALTSFQEACNGLWWNALGIISSDGNSQCHMFSYANAQQQKAMTQLEILICCASLALDHGVAAMRSLCDVAVRAHSVPLSEDAKALVKMACIHGKGTAWRSEYEAITGFAPSTVRRQTSLAPAEEALEQSFCLRALDAVEDWAQALRLGQAKREVGVRLQHAHYHRMLHLLEQHNTEDAETVALNTVVADAVMKLHFARLQDGCFPNTHAIEQSLRLLSAQTVSPLFVLQYAQALTLLPPLTNRRHRKPEKHSDGTESANDSSLSLPQEDLPFTVSAVMLRLVTRAALRLPDAVRQHRLAPNEGVEGLHMFAAFVRWVSEFSRVPCFDRGVVEAVVLLLCTPPKQLLLELTTTQDGTPRCDAGDVRRLLLSALLARCDDETPIVDIRSHVTCLESYRFVSLHCGHKEEDDKDNEEYIPTLATLSVLRSHAEVALRFVGKQTSLHHVMRLSSPLLCRMCAAVVAGMTVTAEGLQPLNQLMQNTGLISPSLRYMLTLIVAEQSTLWGIYYTTGSDLKKKGSAGHRIGRSTEVPVSVVLRSVAGAYDVVRQHFTPSDASMLRGLLLPKHLSAATARADHSGDQHEEEEDDEGYSCKEAMKSPEGKKEEDDEGTMDSAAPNAVWENALNLFDVFLRNAQPDADLSVPFEALIELLCRCGQWKTACRNVTLAGTPTMGTMNTPQTVQHRDVEKEGVLHLLPRHVVVDGFLLKRLLDSMEAARQRHHRRGEKSPGEGGLDPGDGPPGFWRLALHILQQQQQQALLLLNEIYLDGTEKCDVMISSVTLLAIMKTISQGRGEYAPR